MLTSGSSSVYTDVQSMAQLRQQARNDPDATLKQVAKHFESIYMNMMLKSMRAASFGDPNFDSNNSEMYRDMYDSQMSLQLSEQQGLGLAEMLVKQLQHGVRDSRKSSESEFPGAAEVDNEDKLFSFSGTPRTKHDPVRFNTKEDFVRTLMPFAEQAAIELDMAPQVLLAQAALETGWGKHIQSLPNGNSSYNLFNIKASSNWAGAIVSTNTLEYKNGLTEKSNATFRVYDSLQESFSDYVRFIKSNPRYNDALNSADNPEAYVLELQKAGYATDPRYAEKITDILHREIISAPYSEYFSES